MTFKLRHYQKSCIDSIYKWFGKFPYDPLCVLATGTGKSVIIASFIKGVIEKYPDQRIICAIDTKELVEQNYLTLCKMWTFAPAGIYSAGLKKKQAGSQILFGGIQSMYKKAFEIGKADLLIIDECHMLSLKTDAIWQRFITDLKKINPKLRLIGFTATPYRLDSGLLHTGEGAMFGGIAYEYGIKEGIDDGFLCEIVPKSMATKLNVDDVGRSGGEFIETQLQKAVDKSGITKAAVKEIVEYGANRMAWLIFSSGVDHAYHIRDEIKLYGIKCEVIEGNTPSQERADIINDFKAGRLQCIVNNSVLTKGFDAPHIDLIAAMRPTESPVLWLQMVGRGLRICEGKENCLLLDFAQNLSRFGFIDEIRFKDKKQGDGEDGVPPMKECPECQNILHAAMRSCPCGYEFPESGIKIQKQADNQAVLSSQRVYETKEVNDVEYFMHSKSGKPSSMKVVYKITNIESYSEWICFEHGGYARRKAESWWRANTDGNKSYSITQATEYLKGVPIKVEAALGLANTIKKPAAIQVYKDGKYWVISSRSNEELIEVEEDHHQPNQHGLDDFDDPLF